MHRPQALGIVVLLLLAAPRVSVAQTKTTSQQEKQREEERRREEERQREEELKKQVQAEMEKRAQAEREAAEKQAQADQEEQKKKSSGPEPELNLPIRYYVYSAVLSGLGYATGFLAAKPERDLRDPAKHPTPDKTKSIYRRAYYGGLISRGFYGLSGTMGAYAAYKTQSAVRQYFTAKAQQASRQQATDQRLAEATSPAERKAAEVSRALLVPPGELSTEILVAIPKPPPVEAGVFVSPSGDASLSFSVRF